LHNGHWRNEFKTRSAISDDPQRESKRGPTGHGHKPACWCPAVKVSTKSNIRLPVKNQRHFTRVANTLPEHMLNLSRRRSRGIERERESQSKFSSAPLTTQQPYVIGVQPPRQRVNSTQHTQCYLHIAASRSFAHCVTPLHLGHPQCVAF
jgi:hypothetical protein